VSVVLFYLLVSHFGARDEDYDTYILSLRLGGRTIDIWQEYALLFSLPVSILGFVAGSLFGRELPPAPSPPGSPSPARPEHPQS
jgi:hypothetical protein